MKYRQYFHFIFVLFLSAICWISMASHAYAMMIIRDSEIEASFKEWMAPLLDVANMREGDVKIILVGSEDINAFVAGGRNIFIYTGLITEATHVSEVIGVMAHELGHIEGGHLVRMRDELEMASYQSMLAAVLGIGIAAAGGPAEVGSAIYSGGSTVAGRSFLSHSRTQESAADQAALKYFERAGLSPKGLVTFMHKMQGQELLSTHHQTEYMRTHPMTRDRLLAMEAGLSRSPYKANALPDKWQDNFLRMKAKIHAYLDPARAKGIYGGEHDTLVGQYALAIVDYRQGRLDRALTKLEPLIKQEPKNPYFHEFKGQILLELQRLDEAIEAYQKAIDYAPEASLIRIDLAQTLVQKAGQDNHEYLRRAARELGKATQKERRTPRLHRLAATIHGRLGDEALAQLHLAEEAVLQGDFAQARVFATRAENVMQRKKDQGNNLDQGTWLRVQDILQYINNKKEKR